MPRHHRACLFRWNFNIIRGHWLTIPIRIASKPNYYSECHKKSKRLDSSSNCLSNHNRLSSLPSAWLCEFHAFVVTYLCCCLTFTPCNTLKQLLIKRTLLLCYLHATGLFIDNTDIYHNLCINMYTWLLLLLLLRMHNKLK